MAITERIFAVDAGDPKERYLSKNDVVVLRRGLELLWSTLNDLPRDQLPTAILLPDTSMRPLAHAIMPVINDVYRKRGAPLPKYDFVVAHAAQDFFISRASLVLSEADWAEVYGELCTPSFAMLRKSLQEAKREGDQEQIRYYEEEIDAIPIRAKQYRDAWVALRERLDEIYQQAQRQNPVRLMIVDDYLRNGQSLLSINDILSAFNEEHEAYESPLISPFYFSFYHNSPGDRKEEGIHKKELSDQLIGPYLSASDRETQGLDKGYAGFKFRDSASINPEKVKRYKQHNARHIGYEKKMGEKYAGRSPHANKQDMMELRSLMRAEAQQVLDQHGT